MKKLVLSLYTNTINTLKSRLCCFFLKQTLLVIIPQFTQFTCLQLTTILCNKSFKVIIVLILFLVVLQRGREGSGQKPKCSRICLLLYFLTDLHNVLYHTISHRTQNQICVSVRWLKCHKFKKLFRPNKVFLGKLILLHLINKWKTHSLVEHHRIHRVCWIPTIIWASHF